jgi:nucleotide-binding universal stress UspA family protein
MHGRGFNKLDRSLVCGVNDSEGARAAARVAARMAERLSLKLILVHVGEVRAIAESPRVAAAAALDEVDGRKAQYLLADIAVAEGLGPVERRVQYGVPSEQLARVAEQEDAEMIVVGSRGRGALKAALLGSVSSNVLASARCPVLIVPPGAARRA